MNTESNQVDKLSNQVNKLSVDKSPSIHISPAIPIHTSSNNVVASKLKNIMSIMPLPSPSRARPIPDTNREKEVYGECDMALSPVS
ncbi:MAG: hypothetical protein Homavirus4_5 [Homavirus sp.]|uniref:Uncharacterized protein n=1 Tax=Homavirus sp. TaxID=2487769 RepID=A0A3G5A4L4_9VIRU|nr:MAG: hypothetical protein Homavirus4_5 [Homavirus sp.]